MIVHLLIVMHSSLRVTCIVILIHTFLIVTCALLVIVVAVQIFNVLRCGSDTVACRKHEGVVVGWLCTKLEGSVGKLDLAIRKYYRMLFSRCT